MDGVEKDVTMGGGKQALKTGKTEVAAEGGLDVVVVFLT
jgi:hypothetical protein